jgi:small-conductance mechanosensitive channel
MNFNLQQMLQEKFQLYWYIGIRLVFIAIVFEIIGWWLSNRIEKWTTPLLNQDASREASWRARRRGILRHAPRIVARSVTYTVAIILVFEVFGVPVLPLSLAVGAVIAFFAAMFLPIGRDMAQGYALLAEDTLAPGDAVEIDGRRGVVEKVTLRATWLRDEAGRVHVLSNGGIQNVTVYRRREGDASAHDPLKDDARKAKAAAK